MKEKELVELLTEAIKRKAVHANRYVKGYINHVNLCQSCGFPIWKGASPLEDAEAESQMSLDISGEMFCQGCEEFKYRYPDVFAWVLQTHKWLQCKEAVEEKLLEEGDNNDTTKEEEIE